MCVTTLAVDVMVGTANLSSGGTLIPADSWKIHPDWIPGGFFKGNDIALIHLSTPLTFSDSIQPICYPESDDVLGSAISACDRKFYGWGYRYPNVSSPIDILQKLDVSLTESTTACTDITDGRAICIKGDPPSSSLCNISFHAGIAPTLKGHVLALIMD
ncbi:unnamed protein product [Darwinula stevensoni]|uniref:Peptidase S1 domain-containing protein n=1 Tax=Darwinula stevensoni TaxID=69355 RepID=A0A7R9ABS0_9CRUS|nr:unnamed protein product [Darwinula stevensoni]CAG0899550.1 unnamed protein product [Darwinula stevensoni]